MQSTYVQIMLDRQRDEQRRWEKYKRQRLRPQRIVTFGERIKDFLRWLAAFLFTQVGVCALVVGYTIVGAFVFSSIEEERGIQQVCVTRAGDVTPVRAPWWKRTVPRNNHNC
jgi:hypothetical protein